MKDPQYYPTPEWAQTFVTDDEGVPFLLRRVPIDLPSGRSELFDISSLTPEQRREGDAFHELGHAIGYLHFGELVAISMKERKEAGSSAHVSPWGNTAGWITPQQRRIALAAGEWSGMRWLKESNLWSPLEEYVLEVRSFQDRRELRDHYGVTFGVNSAPHDFDTLLSTTGELLDPYWDLLRRLAPELSRSNWWGWDETAERLGFASLLEDKHRITSQAIRSSDGLEDGVHCFEYDCGSVMVTRKGGDWKSAENHMK